MTLATRSISGELHRRFTAIARAVAALASTASAGSTPDSNYPVSVTYDVRELFPTPPTLDYTWAGPVARCGCGSELLMILASFDDDTGEMSSYMTSARCAACGADLIAVTEADRGWS